MQRTLSLGPTRLVVDDDGAGDAILCLHAIGHDARDFDRVRARLRDRYRVIAVDWPGHGRSPWDGVAPTAGHYARLLDGVVRALDVGPAIVVGNSIGGAAAIAWAAEHPDEGRGLVLENPGGLAPVDDRTAQLALAAFARLFAAGARGARWFPAAFGLYYRTVLQRGAARDARRRIVARARELAPLLEQAWRGFARPDADLRSLAPRVTCPVLFAWATRDAVVSLSRSLPAIRAFPDARLVRLPAGHAAHLETPEAFERALEEFVEELGPSRRSAERAEG